MNEEVVPRHCVICEQGTREIPRKSSSNLRGLGWICEKHLPKKFPGTYKAKCPIGVQCEVKTVRDTGYRLTSDFYNHLLTEHISPQDAYVLISREVNMANELIAVEQTEAAKIVAPTHLPEDVVADVPDDVSSHVPAIESTGLTTEQIIPTASDFFRAFWAEVKPFPTRHRFVEGSLTSNLYMGKLASSLREDKVSNMLDGVFNVRGGMDYYTGCDRTLLLALDNAYEDNNEEMNENKDHPAFVKRTVRDEHRRFFEVDHVFDVQLWVRAILITNSCTDMDQFVGTLTLNHLEYLRTIINDPENLNVTTWKVNNAKGKLLTTFLNQWQFSNQRITPWNVTSLMTIELSSQTKKILQNELHVNEGPTKVEQRLCRLMRRTLFGFIAPKLDLPVGEEWLSSERVYCAKLLSVLKHMCLSLWPIDQYPLEFDD